MIRARRRARSLRGASFFPTSDRRSIYSGKLRLSVVNITTIGVERDLFTLNLYQIPQGTGSGFVWDHQRRHHHQFPRDSKRRLGAGDFGRPIELEGAGSGRGA